jgi:16S rRNA U1498 N3-methylase RsmE
LRLKYGEKVVVLDNSGDEMLTELNQWMSGDVQLAFFNAAAVQMSRKPGS